MTFQSFCGKVWFLAFIGLVSGVAALLAEDRPGVAEPAAFERRPYDVRLFLALDSSTFDAGSTDILLRDIRQTVTRCIGDPWSFEVSTIDWLSPIGQVGLQRLDWSVVDTHRADQKADIWFAAAVESRPIGMRVSVRSWQPEVQAETRVVWVDIMDPRDLAVALLRLCRDLALPMGIVERVEDRKVRIRLRAGELSSPDSTFAQIGPDEVFIPMLAFRNKDKIIEKLQPIPWTCITVDQVEDSTVEGTVQSGLRLALGGKKASSQFRP